MPNVQIFKDYDEFCNREDKAINGVTQEFLDHFKITLNGLNVINCEGCWNCEDCEDCKECINCFDCAYCIDCKRCMYCINCEECIECHDCKNCTRYNKKTDCKGFAVNTIIRDKYGNVKWKIERIDSFLYHLKTIDSNGYKRIIVNRNDLDNDFFIEIDYYSTFKSNI